MQTNALSRQAALLAEPKTPLESSVFYYDRTVTTLLESAIDNRPPSNIGRACVTTKEAKRKIITASER